MTEQSSIRWRMIALFCASTGVLLMVCYAGFYLLFQRVVRKQLDRRLGEIAAPMERAIPVTPAAAERSSFGTTIVAAIPMATSSG